MDRSLAALGSLGRACVVNERIEGEGRGERKESGAVAGKPVSHQL